MNLMTMVLLNQLTPSEAIETLGVYLTADGNHKAQKLKMIQQAQTFANQMRLNKMD